MKYRSMQFVTLYLFIRIPCDVRNRWLDREQKQKVINERYEYERVKGIGNA
jgi:hypothetical protein